MPENLQRAAIEIAETLRANGHRGWLVGGCVRDLTVGRAVSDADMASAATPEEVERFFPRTFAVGRAFGTVIVHTSAGEDVELTTFRSERGYSDGRRPDEVQYGRSVEEDAERRDFTCNALYLDPLTDEVRDPSGGVADIAARRLRCVGEAERRFSEDGLRLLRMARFLAALDFEPAPGLFDAARGCAERLAAVSPERKREELARVFRAPRVARALDAMLAADLWRRVHPGLPAPQVPWTRLWSELEEPPGEVLGFAAILAPFSVSPSGPSGSGPGPDPEGWLRRTMEPLAFLRPSGQLSREVEDTLRMRVALADWCERGEPDRAERVRAMRRALPYACALKLERAWARLTDRETSRFDAWLDESAHITAEELHPEPWLASHDIEEAGLPRGPRWGALLREAETRQLNGEFADRDAALAWLRDEARAPEEGGA